MAIMRWTVDHQLAQVVPPHFLRSLTVMAGFLAACFPVHIDYAAHYDDYFDYQFARRPLFSLPHAGVL